MSLLLFAAAGTPATAQTTTQAWPDATVTIPIDRNWSTLVEAIGRGPASATVPAQVEGQVRVYRNLTRHIKIGGGYAHVVSYNDTGSPVVDHQIVQELIWASPTFAGFDFTIRNRLEQRFVTGTHNVSWRLREQIRLKRPIGKTLALSLWTEPFFSLNRTEAATSTVDQVRSFAGILVALDKRSNLEIGYLRQNIYRASGSVAVNAVPAVITVAF